MAASDDNKNVTAAVAAGPTAKPNWDMTAYFPELGGKEYVAFRDGLVKDIGRIGPQLEQAPRITQDPARWDALLAELEDLGSRLWHIGSYLGCMGAADSRDEVAQRETAALAGLSAEAEKRMVAVRARLAELSDAEFAELVARARLSPVKHSLARTRLRGRWAMKEELESLAADLEVNGLSAWGRLYDRVSGSLTFDMNGKKLPVSMTRSLLEDADPGIRKAALEGSNRAWESMAEVLASCLNAIAGTRHTLYERRGIDHFLKPALFDSGIERGTLDAMMQAVTSRQEVPRRYLRRKAKLLGKAKLGFQDLMAPLPSKEDARITWAQATDRVLEAFGKSYPALREFADHALSSKWVDYEARDGKRPGGFCTSSPLIGQSRIFLTFQGAMGDMQTLSHELGHAFHNWIMKNERPWARDYPMTLAETASTFAEQVVTEALLDSGQVDRRAVLDHRLQDAAAFLLNIPMRYDFERAFYEERRAGEVSVSRLKELMLEAQRKNYGDSLDENELDPWFWASKLHFYITDISFYNFPYTFGYLFSLGLFARARAEGPSFLPKYEELLRRTGSDTAERVVMGALGIDLTQPDFWNQSIDLVERDLKAFEGVT